MRIGVDVGGTKIEAAALDEGATVVARHRVSTPRDDYDGTLRAIVEAIAAVESPGADPASVGIGIPGAISPVTGLVKNANSVWLIGRPLGDDLERRLGRPVRVTNDANCFALSEATDGAGQGADVVFGVIVGTGTGGGLVVHGRVVEGHQRVAGEWGHNPLPWPEDDERPGPDCYCGRAGCIETFLSGPGLTRDYRVETGDTVPAVDVAARADRGEAAANRVMDRYERRLARALASIINVVDPDVIVLGGGLSNVERLYVNVPRQWGTFVFSDTVRTPLVRARHGDSSGVRGAAWLW